MIGMLRNIPGTPQRMPHRTRERMTASGLMSSERLTNRGSIRLATASWTIVRPPATRSAGPAASNWTRAMSAGRTVATSEPTLGMKFNTSTISAQKAAKSTPTARISR